MSAQARPAPEELLGRAITAHGGRERWSEVETITVSLTPSGPVFLAKGRRRDVGRPLSAVISTRAQRAVIEDFGGVPGRQGVFTPERTWIEDADGRVLAEQRDFSRVRGALGSLRRWSDLDQLYFSGYALSTYFTLPFALQWPGVELSATPPVRQRGATLEGIAVRFPAGFVTHSGRQRVYFDAAGLLVRHDYQAEPIGPYAAGAHYSERYFEAGGLQFARRRRVYPRIGRRALRLMPILALDIHDCAVA